MQVTVELQAFAIGFRFVICMFDVCHGKRWTKTTSQKGLNVSGCKSPALQEVTMMPVHL